MREWLVTCADRHETGPGRVAQHEQRCHWWTDGEQYRVQAPATARNHATPELTRGEHGERQVRWTVRLATEIARSTRRSCRPGSGRATWPRPPNRRVRPPRCSTAPTRLTRYPEYRLQGTPKTRGPSRAMHSARAALHRKRLESYRTTAAGRLLNDQGQPPVKLSSRPMTPRPQILALLFQPSKESSALR